MDIVEFFQLSSGKWFSQRTSHHLAFQQNESSKSELQIELLPKTDAAVVKLCEQHEIDPALALCGARVNWDGTMESKEKYAGNTMLVPIADPDKPNEGKLLRELGGAETAPVAGRYVMSSDDTLTIITEYQAMSSEEQLWFASNNLRLRTSILKQSGGFSMASFYSEIRKGVAAPPADAKTQSVAEKNA
ncbi:MAG: phycobiliprotein lyase [Verrucomicrobia bacterium]|nr:phycobiliprotein lyase [Leptolyngbya sp. ES-bin-22]